MYTVTIVTQPKHKYPNISWHDNVEVLHNNCQCCKVSKCSKKFYHC